MPPNRFESEVESFLEGSHGDRTHIKRADHHTVTPLCGTLLNSTNCAALRQLQFAVQFSVEDYLNSYLNADASPALTPFRTSFEPYLRQLSDAGVDISRMIPPMSGR